MATPKRILFTFSIIPLLSACVTATPQPKLELDAGTSRLPGTVLVFSNLEDNYTFHTSETIGKGRQSRTVYTNIDVGTSSHNLFLEGFAGMFDKAIGSHLKTTEQDFDYQLIPSVAYAAHHVRKAGAWSDTISCAASVRYGALLRQRDGKSMEFDSGWVEENHEPQGTALPLVLLPLHMAVALLPNITGWDDYLTSCYSTAFTRAEERAFHALAQKIRNSQFTAPTFGDRHLTHVPAPNAWAIEHADAKIKLARLIDSLRIEVSTDQPRKNIFVGPFVSTNEQLDVKFTTYVQQEIFRGMYRTFPRQFVTPSDLYWPLDRHGMKLNDLNSIGPARKIALESGADSILLCTFTTEEPWIKVQLSLRDLSSDTEIASKETKLYKDVTLRALLE